MKTGNKTIVPDSNFLAIHAEVKNTNF